MRRLLLLVGASVMAAPLFATPAEASIYCGPFGPIENAWGPVCTVKCAMTLDLSDPCWIQD